MHVANYMWRYIQDCMHRRYAYVSTIVGRTWALAYLLYQGIRLLSYIRIRILRVRAHIHRYHNDACVLLYIDDASLYLCHIASYWLYTTTHITRRINNLLYHFIFCNRFIISLYNSFWLIDHIIWYHTSFNLRIIILFIPFQSYFFLLCIPTGISHELSIIGYDSASINKENTYRSC